MPHRPHMRRTRQRRGISLMEVLISVFVISIGLLSVVTLIPLASHQTEKGTSADRASAAGKHAVRTFRARGMNNPANWLFANGGVVSVDPTDGNSPLNTASAKAYCLDPRMIAVRNNAAAAFPIGGSPTMTRITLRNAPSAAIMAKQMADEVFQAQDDLAFEIDEDEVEIAPVQHATGGKRVSKGDFSWLATLVREGAGQTYTLSIVVFDGRDSAFAVTSEHTYACNFKIASPSLGGGEVALTSSGTVPDNEALANVAPGNWVMVASGSVFRWYRVNGTGDASQNPRELTLIGSDWTGSQNAQATILPGIVAVYERTITLNTTSPWQP